MHQPLENHERRSTHTAPVAINSVIGLNWSDCQLFHIRHLWICNFPGTSYVDDNIIFGTFEEFRDPKDGEEEKEEPDHRSKSLTYITSLEHA